MSSAKKIGLFACTGVVAGNMMGSGIAFILDKVHTLSRAAYPPAWYSRTLGRATLGDRFTWHFSSQGLSHMQVALHMRALLPHVFTLTRQAWR